MPQSSGIIKRYSKEIKIINVSIMLPWWCGNMKTLELVTFCGFYYKPCASFFVVSWLF